MRLHSALRFAPPRIDVETRDDGSLLLRSPQPLLPYARAVGVWLEQWAVQAPERVFLAERVGETFRTVRYGEAREQVRRIGGALLRRGLDEKKPVAILSDNSIDHALLALAAMHVGVPVAPISPAYSLLSQDHKKLRYIFELLRPGLVYVSDPIRFAAALKAVGASALSSLEPLLEQAADAQVDEAFAKIGPHTLAKILFTSGSTGEPKGVINTHGMLCANSQMLAQGWPFVEDQPPVLVDWLPWNHTFGGNHNFHLVLRNGGTLYIDGGKPTPDLVRITVQNLKAVSPTMYFNVPRGYDLLLPHLESDAELRRSFFRRLDVIFYAAAALPQNLWERIEKLAATEKDSQLAMLSAWGSTETSPLATQVHFPIERAGVVGLPVSGCELKLVPCADKLEVRVRGPHVTPGYYQRDDLTRAAFDDEGFYRIGDAMKFVDPGNPQQGLAFDGRVAEDFKLASGTWVHVGAVRVQLIAATDPLVQDAVITGHDRTELGALLFLSPAATKNFALSEIRERLIAALRQQTRAGSGASSTCPQRVLILSEPPAIDESEITDKGYLNQQAILRNRAASVERLYSDDPEVIRT